MKGDPGKAFQRARCPGSGRPTGNVVHSWEKPYRSPCSLPGMRAGTQSRFLPDRARHLPTHRSVAFPQYAHVARAAHSKRSREVRSSRSLLPPLLHRARIPLQRRRRRKRDRGSRIPPVTESYLYRSREIARAGCRPSPGKAEDLMRPSGIRSDIAALLTRETQLLGDDSSREETRNEMRYPCLLFALSAALKPPRKRQDVTSTVMATRCSVTASQNNPLY
jgi:hypothetical protein